MLGLLGGTFDGLLRPLEGLDFAPGQRAGTSNVASQPMIELAFEGPGALVIVERAALGSLSGAL